jgi:hypothetical protein
VAFPGQTADGAPSPSRRDVALFLLAIAGLAASITLMFLAMRAVMAIGGSCAEGGPYVIEQHCPAGSTAAMFIGVFGIFGWGGLGLWTGRNIGGAYGGVPFLAWPALFISLGWNFLQSGFSPGEGAGWEWGFLIPGVLFVLMGGIPLVAVLAARSWVRQVTSSSTGSRPQRVRTIRSASEASASWARAASSDQSGQEAPTAAEGLVGELERLVSLHRQGDLSDAEFDAAKAALLRMHPGGEP